jgi:apolipoprotein N-acyltransferase
LIDASGAINPYPFVSSRIAPRTEGYSVAQLFPRHEDEPLTFYTRRGDFFAYVCVLLSIGTLITFRSKACKRKRKEPTSPLPPDV